MNKNPSATHLTHVHKIRLSTKAITIGEQANKKQSVSDATMTNVTLSRMLRGKVRTNTCRIIILTSIVWLLVDVVVLMHYVDVFGPADTTARRSSEYDVEVSDNQTINFISMLHRFIVIVVVFINLHSFLNHMQQNMS